MNDFEQKLYALEMGEVYALNGYRDFIRVPGGWVYCEGNSDAMTSVFIPYTPSTEQVAAEYKADMIGFEGTK